MAKLIIFSNVSGTTAAQKLAACVLRYKYPDATLKDITAVNTGNISTYCGTTLVDNTYTDIFLACTTQTSGATGVLTYDQVAMLCPKIITANQDIVRADSVDTNASATSIVLDAGASAVTDAYKNMFIITQGTNKPRMITAYNGTSKVATVVTTSSAITTTETYIIYNPTHILQLGNIEAATAKTPAILAWEACYPDTVAPLIVRYLSAYLVNLASGQAAAIAAGTITLAAAVSTGNRATSAEHATNDFYAGKWVYVYSSTLGFGQYAQIDSYVGATQVATLTANWSVTPTGTVVYRIVDTQELCNLDKACELIVNAFMIEPNGSVQYKFNKFLMFSTIELEAKLFDLYGELAGGGTPANVDQDIDLFDKLTQMAIWLIYADAFGAV